MKTEKGTCFEWLAIGLLRRHEERSGMISDLPIDPSQVPYRFLADRAERLLPQATGITSARIRFLYRVIIWTPILCVLLLGFLFFPFDKVRQIFGGGELVNLAGAYSLFMGVQLLFLVISAFALFWTILLLFWNLSSGKRKKGGATGSRMSGGWLGAFLIGFTRPIYSLIDFCQNFRKKGNLETGEADIRDFFDLFFQSRRPLLFFGGFLSHLFWMVLSLSVLLILIARMQSNRYEYCWRSSLGDRDQVEWLVENLGDTVSHLISLPSERDIDWLFDNSTKTRLDSVSDVSVPLSSSEESKIRRRWSVFLLALVLIYAVIPRLFFMMVYGALFHWSKRDFRPDLSDPYFAELIDRATTKTQPVSEVVGDDRPDNEPLSKPILSYEPSEETRLEKASASADVVPDGILALGYDVELSDERWRSILDSTRRLYLFGNVMKTRTSERDFLAWLSHHAEEIGQTVLLIDSGFPPAKQIRLWMQNDLFGRLPASKNYVILSCGERLRRKFGENVIGIGERLSDWADVLQQMAEAIDRPVIPIDGYDHELDAEVPRKRLAAYFRSEFNGETKMDEVKSRFSEAKTIILRQTGNYLNETVGKSFSDEAQNVPLEDHLTRGYSELAQLYRQGDSLPLDQGEKRLPLIDGWERIPEEWRDRFSAQNILPTDFAEKWAAASSLIDRASVICRKLSPKSALFFGVAGLSLPLAAACSPLLAGGLTLGSVMATLGGMGTLLPTALISGSAGAVAGSVVPLSFSKLREKGGTFFKRKNLGKETPDKLEIDSISVALSTLTIPLLVWALIFELQGESEERIADDLAKLLAPAEERTFADEHELEGLLDEIEKRLAERKEGKE